MEPKIIRGMWKLVDITNSQVSRRAFDRVLHFVDERYYYEITQGEVTRHRYHANPETDPAQINSGRSLGIYKFEGGKLHILRASPGKPRPTAFAGGSVAIYENAGEGPMDWKTQYKQRIRAQMARIAQEFGDQPA